MSVLHICLIAGGALILLIIVFVCAGLSNKKKTGILDEKLKKFQQENQEFENINRVIISEDKKAGAEVKQEFEGNAPPENADEVVPQPQVEEFKPEEDEIWKQEESMPIEKFKNFDERAEFKYQTQPSKQNFFKPKEIKLDAKQNRENDFEKFMNEHSYSRKILDKKMIDKIKRLPPELKAMILTSVFDKFDDNK